MSSFTGRAPFLAVEGIDGAGKSTVARELARALHAVRPNQVALFPFPSIQGEVGKLIRRVFEGEAVVSTAALGHLMAADAIDFQERLQVLYQTSTTVICDRYALISGWVYQTQTQPLDVVLAYQQSGMLITVPDVTFILDVSEATACKRCEERAGPAKPIFYDQAAPGYFHRLRTAYHAYYYMHAKSTMVLDGEKSVDQLVAEIIAVHDQVAATLVAMPEATIELVVDNDDNKEIR
jgi:dTMP kinase